MDAGDSTVSQKVQVAVVGGGIVGCSVLYWLAKLGWSETILLERRELTSGSTWHAAGNVTYFGHYPSITRLYFNSIKSYLQAEQESGQSVGFHPAGSLRLATTQSELDAYKELVPMYEKLGIEYKVVGPGEMSEIHPLLVTDGIYGAAYTPTDGHVDASGATHALAKSARQMGAEIKRQCPVSGLKKIKGGWLLSTNDGDIHAENVVLASSFWTREMAQQLGLNLPLYALEHQEVVTGPCPELASLGFEVPTVRDPYGPSNTRQEGNGYLCGVYESNPQFWSVDGIPGDFKEELLPPDIERLETHLLRVMERIPSFGEAGIKVVNNGPICYTPDGCPLLGPVDQHPGLWLASGFCVGIGTGGGSGEYLARWMIDGSPQYDLPIVYPSRFSNDLSREECLEQIEATYVRGYTAAP
jgi:glycine/D-amino acid oxidase-like deaminating enzyme